MKSKHAATQDSGTECSQQQIDKNKKTKKKTLDDLEDLSNLSDDELDKLLDDDLADLDSINSDKINKMGDDKTDDENDSDKLLDEELDNELKDLSDFSLSDTDKNDKKFNKNIGKKEIEKNKPGNEIKKRGRPPTKTPVKNKKSPTLSDLSDINDDTSKKQKIKQDSNKIQKNSDNKTNIAAKIPQSGSQPPMDISESILQIRHLITTSKPFNKKEKILILDALLTDDITGDQKNKKMSQNNINANRSNGGTEIKRGRRANLDQDTKEEQKNFVKD